MDPLVEACLVAQAVQQRPDIGGLDRAPIQGTEQSRPSSEAELAALVDPTQHDRHRPRVESDHPTAVPFAVKDRHRSGIGVDVLRLQRQRFRQSESCSVEDDDQRSVVEFPL